MVFARRALLMAWCGFALTLTATNCAAAVKSVSNTSVAVVGEIIEGDADELADALDERRRSETAYHGFSRLEASFNQATRAKIYASACWSASFAGPKDLRSLL
jgi:hypothetical protein